MKDKTQNENHNSGSDERDGLTQGRIAWPEKITLVLGDCGTEKRWMTHNAIQKRLQETGYTGAPKSLATALRVLVKSGHVERALKPDHMQNDFHREYIYRRTAKPFKAKIMGARFRNGTKADDLQRAFQLRMDHPRLPKWFRDMME